MSAPSHPYTDPDPELEINLAPLYVGAHLGLTAAQAAANLNRFARAIAGNCTLEAFMCSPGRGAELIVIDDYENSPEAIAKREKREANRRRSMHVRDPALPWNRR